jgi:hypothetical protein
MFHGIIAENQDKLEIHANHVVTDCWSTLDIEPISDTVFVYYIKE